MSRPTTIDPHELIYDETIYPRHKIDSTHVTHLADAYQAGSDLPPVVAEESTKRIVDGVHRHKAWTRVHEDAPIAVVFTSYDSEADLFLEAVRLNSTHGVRLSSYDQLRVMEKATAMNLNVDRVSAAMQITVEKAGALIVDRTATAHGGGSVPLKSGTSHLRGTKVTKKQRRGIERAGGNHQLFYVNQVLNLFDTDILDAENVALLAALRRLRDTLNQASI